MPERDIIKNIIDFAFMMKAQLHSDETALLRSILAIAIMEAEDLIEMIDQNVADILDARSRASR
ncbi:MAG: hypothetical protein LDL25_00155 [Hyphomicrobiales bacterium]|uniref:hypothetical protein n=1 Tax=Rhabdaerophilum calidifontis TaxID=2604328 RepID=UPI001238B882|nr:hypothetical protein [Rhabdaerophilum calidifontis]MCA1951765.1 hypothetical protein [Hyphomicrobiales bacterium]MCA1998174.1 hypothetical protein [Hyphomicrobiales bacterium]